MCGIAAMFGSSWKPPQLQAMVASQAHRGPDATGTYFSPGHLAALGHNRLSIIDLSDAGRQPMSDLSNRYWIIFNGEIYNYVELRGELEGEFPFRTRTDTEVLLAAYRKWGELCLDRLTGMFAFVIWDDQEQRAFGARDRFGVKPLHIHEPAEGGLWLASEIKALHAAGVARASDEVTWANYLTSGMYDHTARTFWKGIQRLDPGTCFTWSQERGLSVRKWYDAAEAALQRGLDTRNVRTVGEELLALLEETVRLRFRSDVAVGVCLSGGFDSSLLLGLIHRIQGVNSTVKTFTFFCGDPAYDETPWVEQILAKTHHPACYCRLSPQDVPELAARVQRCQDEPFGGLPTLGMAKVHERARAEDVKVLLDGNGLDEGWAGYDYYQRAERINPVMGPVQGSRSAPTRPDCLHSDFRSLAQSFVPRRPFQDPLRDFQYRDLCFAKIPRAMRFADRVSMMHSRELREPFLDHRIVELGLRQPAERKILNGHGKWLPRQIAAELLPDGVREAPKRPVQTPQREWLRGPLRNWAGECIESALAACGGSWLQADAVRQVWKGYCAGGFDNSFFVWQWISMGLICEIDLTADRSAAARFGN